MHFTGCETEWAIDIGIVMQRFLPLLNYNIFYSDITLNNIYTKFFEFQFIYIGDSIGIETLEQRICQYLVEIPECINWKTKEYNQNAPKNDFADRPFVIWF